MRLLFDQNLSPGLVGRLAEDYPGSTHVRELGLQAADDESVWELARREGFVIVSKDGDFHQRSFLLGHPPKVIWLRLGNCSTEQIAVLLHLHRSAIEAFGADGQAAFLALG